MYVNNPSVPVIKANIKKGSVKIGNVWMFEVLTGSYVHVYIRYLSVVFPQLLFYCHR